MFIIAITRATIEEFLQMDTSTIEQRLDFVNLNMPMLTRCATEKLRREPNASGTKLTRIDLHVGGL